MLSEQPPTIAQLKTSNGSRSRSSPDLSFPWAWYRTACQGERSVIALMVDFRSLLPAISKMEDISVEREDVFPAHLGNENV